MNEFQLGLLTPVPTGKFVVSFKEGLDVSNQKQVMDAAFGSDIATLNSEVADLDVDFDTSTVNTIYEQLRIGFTARVDQDGPITMQSMMGLRENILTASDIYDHIEFIRPEYMMELCYYDTVERGWGVAEVGAFRHGLDGSGINLAILDSGLDQTHPDFAGRAITKASFNGQPSTDDIRGHGTHCAGIAAGPRQSAIDGVGQYGVASGANLFIGKTVTDRGTGDEEWTLHGLLWALQNECDVISMSLGWPVQPGTPYDPGYERLGALALSQDALVIAAAGNDSLRHQNFVAPVRSPANTPSILSVAAVDWYGRVSDFSNSATHSGAYGVDIGAPGSQIISASPLPLGRTWTSGTSQATPFVAGVAALYAQSDPNLRGARLRDELLRYAALGRDVDREHIGAGIVQVPAHLRDDSTRRVPSELTQRNDPEPTEPRDREQPSGPFDIQVNFSSGFDSRIIALFDRAVSRWKDVITSGFTPYEVGGEYIDRLLIEASILSLDGENGKLADGMATLINPLTMLPLKGRMRFDYDDLNNPDVTDAFIFDIILHEMGHVIGLDSYTWGNTGLLDISNPSDPMLTGPAVMREYAALLGQARPLPVPIANTGGPGTQNEHFRENIFGNELMTGSMAGEGNVLSRLTIAVLDDLGYTVDYASADRYALPTANDLITFRGSVSHTCDHEHEAPKIAPLPNFGRV